MKQERKQGEIATDKILKEFNPGEIVPIDFIIDVLELQVPTRVEDVKPFQFKLFAGINEIKDRLLHVHKLKMSNVRTVGYYIHKPEEHTRDELHELHNKILKNIETAEDSLMHVKTDVLSMAQKKENRDAIARLSSLRLHTRSVTTTKKIK